MDGNEEALAPTYALHQQLCLGAVCCDQFLSQEAEELVGWVADGALTSLEVEGDEGDPPLEHQGDGGAVEGVAQGDVDAPDVFGDGAGCREE